MHTEGDNMLTIGDQVGSYRLESLLGKGGMGQVFLASRDDNLKHKVAIKVLSNLSEEAKKMFSRETEILSSLQHPNIARILDAGISSCRQPWLAMEYVEGEMLQFYLNRVKPDLKGRLKLVLQICEALKHAHQKMVIHRDLKPSNILINTEGNVKLLDFGIAKTLNPDTLEQMTLTQTGMRMMTPEYASPEQINGLHLSAASDVYSLGIILYEMLTGQRPYSFKSYAPGELLNIANTTMITAPSKMLSENPSITHSPSDVRGDLDVIALKALERDTHQRYNSIHTLAADIERFLEGKPILARPATLGYRCRKFLRRNPWKVALASVSLCFIIGFSAYSHFKSEQVSKERDIARQERQTAQEVSQFLVQLFEQVDPDHSKGRQVTALEVLEQGRRHIRNDLKSSPETQRELTLLMARVYRALEQYDTASALVYPATSGGSNDQIWPFQEELLQNYLARNAYPEAEALLLKMEQTEAPLTARDQRNKLAYYGGLLAMRQGAYQDALAKFKAVDRHLLGEPATFEFSKERAALLSVLGRYQEAIDTLENLLKELKIHLGDEHSLVAHAYRQIGETYGKFGDVNKAKAAFANAEKILHKLFGENHGSAIELLLQKASIFIDLFLLRDARLLLEKAQERLPSKLAKDHPLRAQILVKLAYVLTENGEFDSAESHLQEAVTTLEALFPNGHMSLSDAYENMGGLRMYQRNFDEAESYMRRALDMKIKLLGDQHPDLSYSYNNIGLIFRYKGDFETSENLYKRSLGLCRTHLGLNHEMTLTVYSNLGSLYRQIYKDDLALEFLEGANAIAQALYDEGTPERLKTISPLVLQNIAINRYDEARRLNQIVLDNLDFKNLREVRRSLTRLAEIERVTGQWSLADNLYQAIWSMTGHDKPKTHIWYLEHLRHLIQTAKLMGDYQKARDYIQEWETQAARSQLKPSDRRFARMVRLKTQLLLDQDRLSTVSTLLPDETGASNRWRFLYARYYQQKGELEKAEPLLCAAISRWQNEEGNVDNPVATLRVFLTETLLEKGDLSHVQAEIEDLWRFYASVLDAEHPTLQVVRSLEGRYLWLTGRRVEGLRLMHSAHAHLEGVYGRDHIRTKKSKRRLAASQEQDPT